MLGMDRRKSDALSVVASYAHTLTYALELGQFDACALFSLLEPFLFLF